MARMPENIIWYLGHISWLYFRWINRPTGHGLNSWHLKVLYLNFDIWVSPIWDTTVETTVPSKTFRCDESFRKSPFSTVWWKLLLLLLRPCYEDLWTFLQIPIGTRTWMRPCSDLPRIELRLALRSLTKDLSLTELLSR